MIALFPRDCSEVEIASVRLGLKDNLNSFNIGWNIEIDPVKLSGLGILGDVSLSAMSFTDVVFVP